MPLRIALSKVTGITPEQHAKYAKYTEWLMATGEDVTTVDCSVLPIEQALEEVANADGFILTGGADVHPNRYGKESELHRCHVDVERDSLEFALLEKAQQNQLPILGICRGAQLLNVAYGGTLIIDIPTDYKSETIIQGDSDNVIEHRAINGDSSHYLDVSAGSIIKKICGVNEGEVNSAHHQAVEFLAPYFRVSARSSDGLIEAFEVNDAGISPFILGVQWHPERMEYSNPLSLPIAQRFLFECASFQLLVKGRTYKSLVENPPEGEFLHYTIPAKKSLTSEPEITLPVLNPKVQGE
jgi:putative glutamine amidotransferase